MDSRRPIPEIQPQDCMHKTGLSAEQHKDTAMDEDVKRLQGEPSWVSCPSSSGVGEGLGKQIHEAISKKDIHFLRFLVNERKAPLEERNQHGLTPLYCAVLFNWPEGALFLLEHGADVQNSESPPQHLLCSQEPLLHMAVRTGNERLLQELIKRGADIRARDARGFDCASLGCVSKTFVFKCLSSAVTEHSSSRSGLEKDLLFIICFAAEHSSVINYYEVEAFIQKQNSCHQRKMLQLFAACLFVKNPPERDAALRYWRMSAECKPCQLHDHSVEEEVASRSVFADILYEKERSQQDTEIDPDDISGLHIRALFAIEKYLPEHPFLIHSSWKVENDLIGEGKVINAIGILKRLTTLRSPNKSEVDVVLLRLSEALAILENTSEIPSVALLDSMQTIENCLTSVPLIRSATQHTYSPDLDSQEIWILVNLFTVFLRIMIIYLGDKVRASPEQLLSISSHVKHLICSFPHTQNWSLCNLLGSSNSSVPINASVIKSLVAYSAEARGMVRQLNSPVHLLSDRTGNTLLHCLADFRCREFLVEEGVLQCFLDHGADLCTRNSEGQTVRSILVRRGVCTEKELLPSLQCLAAAAFMGHDCLSQRVQNCRPAVVKHFLLDH